MDKALSIAAMHLGHVALCLTLLSVSRIVYGIPTADITNTECLQAGCHLSIVYYPHIDGFSLNKAGIVANASIKQPGKISSSGDSAHATAQANVGWAWYADTYAEEGWDRLEITIDPDQSFPDVIKARAAGFIEGSLTAQGVAAYWFNYAVNTWGSVRVPCPPEPDLCAANQGSSNAATQSAATSSAEGTGRHSLSSHQDIPLLSASQADRVQESEEEKWCQVPNTPPEGLLAWVDEQYSFLLEQIELHVDEDGYQESTYARKAHSEHDDAASSTGSSSSGSRKGGGNHSKAPRHYWRLTQLVLAQFDGFVDGFQTALRNPYRTMTWHELYLLQGLGDLYDLHVLFPPPEHPVRNATADPQAYACMPGAECTAETGSNGLTPQQPLTAVSGHTDTKQGRSGLHATSKGAWMGKLRGRPECSRRTMPSRYMRRPLSTPHAELAQGAGAAAAALAATLASSSSASAGAAAAEEEALKQGSMGQEAASHSVGHSDGAAVQAGPARQYTPGHGMVSELGYGELLECSALIKLLPLGSMQGEEQGGLASGQVNSHSRGKSAQQMMHRNRAGRGQVAYRDCCSLPCGIINP